MKKIFILLALCGAFVLATGCASFKSTQNESTNKDGVTVRTTTIKARTFWDAKSELAKLRATTTDKTQGVTIGSLNEASSGTNAVAALIQILQILQTARPIP
jgi:uncharacterized protein YceK